MLAAALAEIDQRPSADTVSLAGLLHGRHDDRRAS
jgi:hypothetical protein